jgi:RNA-directed DNA polymerase
VSREAHARFCERRRVQLPPPTLRVVMCKSREQAEAALARLTVLLAELGLVPKAAKTRIVHLAEGEEGLDFLGFHHRLVRGRTPKSAQLTFLARWPARKAVQRARDRIREITGRKWLWMPVEDIVRDLNLFLRGWVGYCVPRGHVRFIREEVRLAM